jgi:ADP-ribosylglycohydrolase
MDLGKFQGALIGTYVGDALGMPVEGMTVEQITMAFEGSVSDMMEAPHRSMDAGTYTDDTEMMIGLAEGLIEAKGPDCAVIGAKFVENFDPNRGYGRGTINVLGALKGGARWDEPAREIFDGEGSYGNGAAMRVAPLGCLYHDRLDILRAVAEDCSRITHAHPLGIEAGVLQAMAVGLAVASDPKEPLDTIGFIDTLMAMTDKAEFVKAFETIKGFFMRAKVTTVNDVITEIGNDIRGYTAVPAAIYSFLSNWRSFETAVIYAVNLGGDTDTIGAMTGALAGSYHGVAAIPDRWTSRLENREKGRDYVMDLGKRLWDLKAAGGI